MFVKPTANGKFLVKVDKVHVLSSNNKVKKYAWHPKTSTSLPIVGDLSQTLIPIKEHMNISVGYLNVNTLIHPLVTTITNNSNNSNLKIGYPKLLTGLHHIKKEKK